MNYREVGNTGIRVSDIGFGCGGNAGLMVKGTPEQQREAISVPWSLASTTSMKPRTTATAFQRPTLAGC